MKINQRHIRLICFHWTRYAVRSGAGLVYLMMALVFGLSVAQMVLTPVEQTMAASKRAGYELSYEETVAQIVDFGRPVVAWVLGVAKDKDEPGADGTDGYEAIGHEAVGNETAMMMGSGIANM